MADRPFPPRDGGRGSPTRSGTAAEFGKSIDDETCKWSAVVCDAGLKREQAFSPLDRLHRGCRKAMISVWMAANKVERRLMLHRRATGWSKAVTLSFAMNVESIHRRSAFSVGRYDRLTPAPRELGAAGIRSAPMSRHG